MTPALATADESDDIAAAAIEGWELSVDEVLEGSEEITEEELADLEENAVSQSGIIGLLIACNNTNKYLWISRGSRGLNLLGGVPPILCVPFPIGDFSGDTKLWAFTKWGGRPMGTIYRKTVGTVATYRWNIR
jgi:hypothetical protein